MTGKLAFWNYEGEPPKLNLKTYHDTIWSLINAKAFFKRFRDLPKGSDKRILYEQIISRASVELYEKGQIVFPKDRVGIVMMGSCEVRKHNNKNLLKPYIVKKALEGDILGWADGDEKYSSSPLSWIFVMQDNTEVIFIEKNDWDKLWAIQKSFTEQQIVLQKLE